jgi:hypothetical protein
MRNGKTIALFGVIALGIAFATGCAKQQTAETTTTDSLLATTPEELPPPGDINPQTSYEPAPSKTPSRPRPAPSTPAPAPTRTVPSGTPIMVSVQSSISSSDANVGDTWTGTVSQAVVVDGRTLIPEGSPVTGTVSAVKPAQKGDRAMLDLALTRITVDGRSYRVQGGTEAIVAGSTRARNLGAIAAGAGAGALIGKAVSGSGKGAVIGGIIGGAAASGAVAASKGYQVAIKPGTNVDFVINEPVAVRL